MDRSSTYDECNEGCGWGRWCEGGATCGGGIGASSSCTPITLLCSMPSGYGGGRFDGSTPADSMVLDKMVMTCSSLSPRLRSSTYSGMCRTCAATDVSTTPPNMLLSACSSWGQEGRLELSNHNKLFNKCWPQWVPLRWRFNAVFSMRCFQCGVFNVALQNGPCTRGVAHARLKKDFDCNMTCTSPHLIPVAYIRFGHGRP